MLHSLFYQYLSSWSEIPKNHFIKHHIEWMGFHPQVCAAVNNFMKTIRYKIQSQLRNGMFSVLHISTIDTTK